MKKEKLPIAGWAGEIVDSVDKNAVTIITAETGAGKSTQVPQYLRGAGYRMVVTEPRRLAARTVAQRVAFDRGEELGEVVGYRTAVDHQDSAQTRCLFCTDGLALVRELMGQNRGALILDEVHEWNENMEVLVAWSRHQIEQGVDFKVVVMSATLEAEKLSRFYGGAPVIRVPGRVHPVREQKPGRNLVADVAALARAGRNVLVFLPGKQEIQETIQGLKFMEVSAEILPLHGQLTPEEQAACFKRYGRPKVVVSTNVAQTSVTIDDIDAVVDSGLERRIEVIDGVEGLYLRSISYADRKQRKGRAGRTKEDLIIDHCNDDESDRPDFPVAEILRKRLDQTVLRLAVAGFDMEKLRFFHQPGVREIQLAKRTLVRLGCLEKDGRVTRIGKLVNRLPVSVQYARMLVEADKRGVVDDVLTVAAILELDGLTVPPPSRNRPERPDWRRMVPDEHSSDVMAQLSVWRQAKEMTKEEMRAAGISLRKYFRAVEIRRLLAKAIKPLMRFGTSGERTEILKSVCAGMVEHLYRGRYGVYQNGESVDREIGAASVVRGGDWVVGRPFDLEIKTRRGRLTLRLIELASKVEPTWLAEVAPQLVVEKKGYEACYDPELDAITVGRSLFFQDHEILRERVPMPDHPQAADLIAAWLVERSF